MDVLNNNSLIQSYISENQYGQLLGMNFTILEPGVVDYQIKIVEKHLATPKSAHGGVISSLADATVGVGALSLVCTENKVVSTVEMKVSFFAPAFLNDVLSGKSIVLKKGKKLLFFEAEIRNQNGILIAKANATLNSYPMEKAGY